MPPLADKPPQFGIRHLLIAMLVVALASAVFAPWLRDLTSGQWRRMGLRIGVTIVAFAVTSVLYLRSRNLAIGMMGSRHWDLSAEVWGRGLWQRWHFYGQLAFAALLVFPVAVFDLRAHSSELGEVAFVHSIVAAVIAAIAIARLHLRPNRLLIGDAGIVYSNEFTSWEKVKYFYALGRQPTPIMIRGIGFALEVDAPAEIERELVEFLQSKCQKWVGPRRTVGGPSEVH